MNPRLTVLSSLLLFAVIIGFRANAQQRFEASLDGADTLTRILDQTGRDLKFLATDTRMVVLDLETCRILFYQRGTSFSDVVPLKMMFVK